MVGFGTSVLSAIYGFLRRIGEQGVQVSVPFDTTGDVEFKVKLGGFKPSWIVLHHSFSADRRTRNWDSIRAYHMSYRYQGEIITFEEYVKYLTTSCVIGLEKPWRDIGYNFGIENVDGKITVLNGREIGEVGAHATGFNDKSIGICLIGNYDLEEPSEERLYVMSHLCRQMQLQFGIPRDQVIGHRETYRKLTPPMPVAKSCPGTLFDLEKFRARLRD